MNDIYIIILLVLAILIGIVGLYNRRRDARLCVCGHRYDAHDDQWGSACLSIAPHGHDCQCVEFRLSQIKRKDTGVSIDE